MLHQAHGGEAPSQQVLNLGDMLSMRPTPLLRGEEAGQRDDAPDGPRSVDRPPELGATGAVPSSGDLDRGEDPGGQGEDALDGPQDKPGSEHVFGGLSHEIGASWESRWGAGDDGAQRAEAEGCAQERDIPGAGNEIYAEEGATDDRAILGVDLDGRAAGGADLGGPHCASGGSHGARLGDGSVSPRGSDRCSGSSGEGLGGVLKGLRERLYQLSQWRSGAGTGPGS